MDGHDRLIAARTLTNFPIVIMASTTVATALADWREQIGFLVIVAGLFVLVIAALLFMVVRKLSQQHLSVAAAAATGKAAAGYRRQQYDAGPAAVRFVASGS